MLPSPSSSEEEEEERKSVCKNFDTCDISLPRLNTLVWKKGQHNPDYRLCMIHAANPGFQAKMNSETGSYLITQMVEGMIKNLENKPNGGSTGNKQKKYQYKFFGEIIDEIQEYLHEMGKQQIIVSFNNGTRNLRFDENKDSNTMDEDEDEATALMISKKKSSKAIMEMMEIGIAGTQNSKGNIYDTVNDGEDLSSNEIIEFAEQTSTPL